MTAFGVRVPAGTMIDDLARHLFDQTGRVQSRAARSRDLAVHTACELLSQSFEVRRVIGPDGSTIEHDEPESHYDDGGFPGLRR